MKRILIAGLLLTSSACAYGPGGSADTRAVHDPDGAVRLHVTNQSGGSMEVIAVGSGMSYRLGIVNPGFEGRFVVRPGMILNGPVEFLAGSGRGPLVRSGLLLLTPGDVVDFELAASPVTSFATVRP